MKATESFTQDSWCAETDCTWNLMLPLNSDLNNLLKGTN